MKPRTRSRPCVSRLALAALITGAGALQLLAQSGPSQPVYLVTQTGATAAQAASLASFLNLPPNSVSDTNGELTFLDPTNYLRVPMVPVTDPVITSNLLAQTVNKAPALSLAFEQLDFAALAGWAAYPSNAAVALASAALANSGLTPQSASPTAGHTLLTAYSNDGHGPALSASNALDTEVSYQFTVPSGVPLLGPGAQVQVDFGTNASVTRLAYAARQLAQGPTVSIIDPTTASNRVSGLFAGLSAQISPQLVYYAPPLSLGSVAAIIPWYLCHATATVTNPDTGQISSLRLNPVFIPATDDPNYVPSVSLVTDLLNGGAQVVASANVTGGTPPYTFVWSGSGPETASATGSRVSYTPTVRVTPPKLGLAPTVGAPGFSLTWFDPAQFFTPEWSSNLASGSWSSLTNPVSNNNGQMTLMLNGSLPQAQFFRLRLSSPQFPQPETVMALVTDANGVTVRAQHTFPVAIAKAVPVNSVISLSPCWGVESPYNPGLGTQDSLDWSQGMSQPLFGIEGLDAFAFGSEAYDFQDPFDNSYGDNDSTMDTTDLLLYIGHGNPDVITFTSPWSPDILPYYAAQGAWGNHGQEWLALLSCDVLDNTNSAGLDPSQRWLPNMDGLHFLLGFASEAYAGTGFPKAFAQNMSGNNVGSSINQSWFAAAKARQTGLAALLAPIGPGGVCDLGDYWWGKGKVGPTFSRAQTQGWMYIRTSN